MAVVVPSPPFGQRRWFYGTNGRAGLAPSKQRSASPGTMPAPDRRLHRRCPSALLALPGSPGIRMSFAAMEGPCHLLALRQCVGDRPPRASPVGGSDWGCRNPFDAIWGVSDSDECGFSGAGRSLPPCDLRAELRKAPPHSCPGVGRPVRHHRDYPGIAIGAFTVTFPSICAYCQALVLGRHNNDRVCGSPPPARDASAENGRARAIRAGTGPAPATSVAL